MITGFVVPRGRLDGPLALPKIRDRESYEFALASAAVALDMDERRSDPPGAHRARRASRPPRGGRARRKPFLPVRR